MRTYHLIIIAAVVALGACSQETTTAENEEGVYGSSSGPNPNLADIQNDAANTYPSQAAEGSIATTPGAEGGRSSATTGASGLGPAADANTQQQTTAPP
jgi:hypothetical protein